MTSTFEPNRRDFLYVATTAVGAVGLAKSMIPFIDQMKPDASAMAAGAPIDIEVRNLGAGQRIVVRWRSYPIFVVKRTAEALADLQDQALLYQLAGPESQQKQQPNYADNGYRSIRPEYGVLIGICTHLGCIPDFHAMGTPGASPLDKCGGFLCPCHGSKYDLAGRVFKDVPAPFNLPVPPYRFVTDTVIRIGENPASVEFDLSSIQQI